MFWIFHKNVCCCVPTGQQNFTSIKSWVGHVKALWAACWQACSTQAFVMPSLCAFHTHVDCILDSKSQLYRLDKQALSVRSGQDFRRDRYEKLAKVAHTPGNSPITTCITDQYPLLAPISTVFKPVGGWGSNSVARLMAIHCTEFNTYLRTRNIQTNRTTAHMRILL
jgi:hypothetical protein